MQLPVSRPWAANPAVLAIPEGPRTLKFIGFQRGLNSGFKAGGWCLNNMLIQWQQNVKDSLFMTREGSLKFAEFDVQLHVG